MKKMIEPLPQKIVYIYAFPSPLFSQLSELYDIEFRKDIPENIADEEFIDKNKPSLIILDDQLTLINEDVLNLFIRGTHHLNRSCILTVQNFFFQNPSMRTISLNAHYLVLFKQPRDISQIETLGRQMHPRQAKLFLSAYQYAVQRHFGYLLIDLKSTTDDRLRLRSNLLEESHNGWQQVYVISETTMDVFVLVLISEVPDMHKRCTELPIINSDTLFPPVKPGIEQSIGSSGYSSPTVASVIKRGTSRGKRNAPAVKKVTKRRKKKVD